MLFRIGGEFDYPNPTEWRGLAARARFHGMTLAVVATGDRVDHFVFEPKTGRRHRVTAVSCDCRQFIEGGSCGCQHLALLLVERDWIPEAVGGCQPFSLLPDALKRIPVAAVG